MVLKAAGLQGKIVFCCIGYGSFFALHAADGLGRQDSNLGMRDPKSRDLPLVDAPM